MDRNRKRKKNNARSEDNVRAKALRVFQQHTLEAATGEQPLDLTLTRTQMEAMATVARLLAVDTSMQGVIDESSNRAAAMTRNLSRMPYVTGFAERQDTQTMLDGILRMINDMLPPFARNYAAYSLMLLSLSTHLAQTFVTAELLSSATLSTSKHLSHTILGYLEKGRVLAFRQGQRTDAFVLGTMLGDMLMKTAGPDGDDIPLYHMMIEVQKFKEEMWNPPTRLMNKVVVRKMCELSNLFSSPLYPNAQDEFDAGIRQTLAPYGYTPPPKNTNPITHFLFGDTL